MIDKIKRYSKGIKYLLYYLKAEKSRYNSGVINGKILSSINNNRINEIIKNIHLAEFKVFSQWGDDGIIQFLINYIDIDNKTFIEFGVENYIEANTRFLLINDNWSGMIMDGSRSNMDFVANSFLNWGYDINIKQAFITKENVKTLIAESGFSDSLGILSIDLDGIDYWVWKELDDIFPEIVIVEYNSVFGVDNPWTIPYTNDFHRTNYHYSNLCFGSSLLSLCDLAEEKGYSFIGCNSSGVNAYFIRNDKIKSLKPLTAKEGYVLSKFKESKNKIGQLTYARGLERYNLIKGLEVFNTRTKRIEIIK